MNNKDKNATVVLFKLSIVGLLFITAILFFIHSL